MFMQYLNLNFIISFILTFIILMICNIVAGYIIGILQRKVLINLILCYYGLGEIEKAELLYETDLVQLCPITKRLKKCVEILIGERYYYLKNYDQSYEHLKKLLNYDLNKRQYLGVLYLLAQMDVINGATDQAIKRFKKIAKLGNKLFIARASQEMLLELNFVNKEASATV